MLSIAYSTSLGGLATLIGTPPNAIFASLSSFLHGVDVNFADWMLVGMPISAVSLFITWLYMVNVGVKKSSKTISLIKEKGMISRQLKRLGKMSSDEKIAAADSSTALMWITRGLLWKDFLPMIDDTTIVVIAAISFFCFLRFLIDGILSLLNQLQLRMKPLPLLTKYQIKVRGHKDFSTGILL